MQYIEQKENNIRYICIYIYIFQIGLRLKESLLGVPRSLTVSVSPQGIKILKL